MKKIYERLLALAEKLYDGNQTALAKSIGMGQSTFYGYLNEEGQSKIRFSMLNSILEHHPQISRDWLCFGEGEMLRDQQPAQQPGPAHPPMDDNTTAMALEIASLKEDLKRVKADYDQAMRDLVDAHKEISATNKELRELTQARAVEAVRESERRFFGEDEEKALRDAAGASGGKEAVPEGQGARTAKE